MIRKGENKKMKNFQKSNKKTVMLYIALGTIILGFVIGYFIIFRQSIVKKPISKVINFVNENTQDLNEIQKCNYEIFQPTFRQADGSNYDLRDEMKEQDMILYKKINTYQEYKEIKSKWNNILDMNEKDFESSFMMITSVWNNDMIGLVVDNIETDEDTLYISLIKDVDMNEEDKKKIGISYIIPREMEKDNIICVRNFDDREKDFDTGMKIGKFEEGITSPTTFQYRDEVFQKMIKESNNSTNIKYQIVEPEWQNMMSTNFAIKSNMQDINLKNWQSLGNGYYYLTVTDYSEYVKLMKDYNIQSLTWHDFQYIYTIVIINSNANKIIKANDIIENANVNLYLSLYSETNNDIDKDIEFQGMTVVLPNYMNLKSDFLKLIVND